MNKSLKILTCLSMIFLFSCGQKKFVDETINLELGSMINGNAVKADDLISKTTVKLIISDGMCTGTLISPEHILTAAHCANMIEDRKIEIRSSDDQLISNVLINNQIHPQFRLDYTERFDFAVIKFKRYVPKKASMFSKTPVSSVLTFAKISNTLIDPKNGDKVFIAGFGINKILGEGENVIGSGEGKLRQLNATISNFDSTKSEVEVAEEINTGACYGDSGGPGYIIRNNEVVIWGVDSINSPSTTKDCYEYEFYSRVSAVSKWIETALKMN